MTKVKYPPDFKQYVRDVLSVLLGYIAHGEYSRHLVWTLQPHPDDTPENTVAASIYTNTEYLRVTLTVYPELLTAWNNKSYYAIANTLCHEVAHMLTAPLQLLAQRDAAPSQLRLITDVNERQTQRIANIIEWGMSTRWYDPKNIAKHLRNK